MGKRVRVHSLHRFLYFFSVFLCDSAETGKESVLSSWLASLLGCTKSYLKLSLKTHILQCARLLTDSYNGPERNLQAAEGPHAHPQCLAPQWEHIWAVLEWGSIHLNEDVGQDELCEKITPRVLRGKEKSLRWRLRWVTGTGTHKLFISQSSYSFQVSVRCTHLFMSYSTVL